MPLSIKSQNQILACSVLAVSVGLVYIALPRFNAAINHISIDTAIKEFNPLHAKIPDLIKKGRDSIELFDNPEYWEEMAKLKLHQVQSMHVTGKTAPALMHAQYYIQQSIARAPSNSYLWYRLAIVLILRQAAPDTVSKALLMSIKTGPSEPGIMLDRLRFCLMVLSEFQGSDRDILSSQVVLAWISSPKDFITKIANERINRVFIFLLLKENYPQVLNDMVLTFEKTG